tara:strand:- start:606 stop:986 length:381 start_codon:yes stop_codon:yes gene_type:complete
MLTKSQHKQIRRLGERSAYPELIDEVEGALSRGSAVIASNEDMGTVVFRATHHEGELGMLVWVAIGGKCRNAIANYLPKFELMARRGYGKFIMFETRRKGFRRLAPKFGFTETHPRDGFFVFKKEV